MYYEDLGYNMSDNSTLTVGATTISNNTITAASDGLYMHYLGLGSDMYDNSTITVGSTTISDNTVNSTSSNDSGIVFDEGIDSAVSFTEPVIESNMVSGFEKGIEVQGDEPITFRCNTVENNSVAGLFFNTDGTMTVLYNSLISNGLGVQVDALTTATVEAIDNWWGDSLGPVACASCNKIDAGGGTVNYTPWLSGAARSACGGFSWNMFLPALTAGGVQK